MKILFYSNYIIQKAFEIDLEIAFNHLKKGDDVHFLTCESDMPSCGLNQEHAVGICMQCIFRKKHGFSKIPIIPENIHELKLSDFPNNIILPQFKNIKELKNFEVDNIDIGSSVASTLIRKYREPDLSLNNHRYEIETQLKTAYSIYLGVKAFLEKLKPDLFYIFNARTFSLRPAMRAAQKLAIPFRITEAGGVSNRYIMCENNNPHNLAFLKQDILNTWDNEPDLEKKEQIAHQWFNDRKSGKPQAWYSFSDYQTRGRIVEGFDPLKRNIAIFNSSDDELESVDSEWKNTFFANQEEALKKILTGNLDPNIHFYLRVHPNLRFMNNSQIQRISQLKSPHLTVISPHSVIDTYELVKQCEKVLTFGSTVGIESAYQNKPSIMLGRRHYEHLNSCYIPQSFAETVELLNNPELKPLDNIGAIKYGYWQALRGYEFVNYKPETVLTGKFLDDYIKPVINDEIKKVFLNISQDFINLKKNLEDNLFSKSLYDSIIAEYFPENINTIAPGYYFYYLGWLTDIQYLEGWNEAEKVEIQSYRDSLQDKLKIKLSVVIIAKNEANFIEQAINSIKGIAYEIIVVDTGSLDNTVSIAHNEGCKVIDTKWENDFSKVRNLGITQASGNWVLILDADEELSASTSNELLAFLYKNFNNNIDTYAFRITNPAYSLTEIGSHYREVLFVNNRGLTYQGSEGEFLVKLSGEITRQTLHKFTITHWGNEKPLEIKQEREQIALGNLKQILSENSTLSFRYYYHIGIILLSRKEYEPAINAFKKVWENAPANPNNSEKILILNTLLILVRSYSKPDPIIFEWLRIINNVCPELPEANFFLGLLNSRIGNISQANHYFYKVLSLITSDSNIFNPLGLNTIENKRWLKIKAETELKHLKPNEKL